MRLIEIIGNEGIIPRLQARDRQEAFLEIVEQLAGSGRLPPDKGEEVLMALLKRESLGDTSIGHGVAIPHVKTDLVNEFVGAIALSPEGIAFGNDTVHVIILFLSPARAVSGHLRLLAHIGGILNHEAYVSLLREADGKSEVVDLIRDAERMLFFGEDPDETEDGQLRGGDPILL